MPEKRNSDQDGISARIAGTKETKDTALFPSMDQLDTACSVQAPLGVIKVNAKRKKRRRKRKKDSKT